MSENFELLRNVTIGQYIPTGSPVHRVDPRAKILAGIAIMVGISFCRSFFSALAMLLLILAVARVARIPVSYILRGVALGAPLLLTVFVLQFVFQGRVEPAGAIYVEWGWFRITRHSLQLISVGLVRILGFIFVTSLLTMTSTVTELTRGVEGLLQPFRRWGMPSHELALVNMIALRFVPTLAEEMERVMKAQASRCSDAGNRRFWRPDKAARAFLPLIVPLFIGAFRRAEDLILAMEARCYVGGDRRTKFVLLKSSWRDWAVPAAAAVYCAAAVLLPWPHLRAVLAGLGWAGL